MDGTQYMVKMIVLRISAGLGFLGGLYIFYRKQRSPQFFQNAMGSLIIALAISDMFNSLVGILGLWPLSLGGESGFPCITQGMVKLTQLS
jgi:hypothetical protein